MLFERYIQIDNKTILVGQNNSGTWLCKELPCKTIDEIDESIPKINEILNRYNICEKREGVKQPGVRGLKQ